MLRACHGELLEMGLLFYSLKIPKLNAVQSSQRREILTEWLAGDHLGVVPK